MVDLETYDRRVPELLIASNTRSELSLYFINHV